MVVGDNAQLQSVFLNLGINASHAMPEGGELYYDTKTVELTDNPGVENATELQPGKYVSICVRDTGLGIPEKDIGRIFEPFLQPKGREREPVSGLPLPTELSSSIMVRLALAVRLIGAPVFLFYCL